MSKKSPQSNLRGFLTFCKKIASIRPMSKKHTVKKLPKSIVEIEGEIDAEVFEAFRANALKKIAAQFEMPGFRKGHVPEHVIVKNVPEISILEEMAEHALAEHYPKILELEKIDAIGRPEIGITKIAANNPLGFKITTAVVPEFELPDYKALAKAKNAEMKVADVSDEDIEQAILDIRRMRAHQKMHEDNIPHEENVAPKDEDLPELNDEFVKTLGDFKDVEAFRAKLKENIALEKEREAKDKNRIAIIEEIVKSTTVEVPEILIESELQKLFARFEDDITRMGFKFEDYLKQINKTEDDIRKEWMPDATKRAVWELIVDAIAQKEKIEASKEKVELEVANLLAQYKNVDPDRARAYVNSILRNEEVFKLLEEAK